MDKKNTLLLTVIAIATLLVAVVGATFAYFSAQTSLDESVNYQVTTTTGTNVVFNESTAINFKATIDNFGQDDIKTPLNGTSSPSVTVTGASGGEATKFCYNVTLEVDKNDFKYTTGERDAELLLTIKKNTSEYDTGKISELTYVDASTLFDDEGNQTAWTAVKGWDITERTTKIKIPTLDDTGTYKHEMTVQPNTNQTDSWEVTVTFVNLESNQNSNAMGKEFSGKIHFQSEECGGE